VRAETEARLRDAGEHQWTAERLAVHIRERFGSSRIFVLSNREPYTHVLQGRETVCVVPPSGLVTAIEPVLRACDGVWVAHGSGSEDATVVDEFDHIRVPPDDPRYTLRRVWLSSEEEAGYYDALPTRGCGHCAILRTPGPSSALQTGSATSASMRNLRRRCLRRWRAATTPLSLFRTTTSRWCRGSSSSASRRACSYLLAHSLAQSGVLRHLPWQSKLLEGLLGADLIGFHIPLHCNNFLSTVDRVLESRTDREHMTARRDGHITAVRPYPVSVALDDKKPERWTPRTSREDCAKSSAAMRIFDRWRGPHGLYQRDR